MSQRCQLCKFVAYIDALDQFVCRRNPPQVATVEMRHFIGDDGRGVRQETRAEFPTVTPDTWCGEFKLRPLPKEFRSHSED